MFMRHVQTSPTGTTDSGILPPFPVVFAVADYNNNGGIPRRNIPVEECASPKTIRVDAVMHSAAQPSNPIDIHTAHPPPRGG